jgi:hypothetical protein
MQVRGRSLVLLAIVLAIAPFERVVAAPAEAQVTFVPWKVLNPGDEPAKGDLVLFWIPASRDEMRRSPLLTSRVLAAYASQCVGMQVIRADDVIMIDKLGATGKLPAAVITDAATNSLGSAVQEKGALAPAAVEKLVRDTFARLDSESDKLLDEARTRLDAGDRDAAAEMYRKVIDEKCLFPRKARDAEKALRKLGGKQGRCSPHQVPAEVCE